MNILKPIIRLISEKFVTIDILWNPFSKIFVRGCLYLISIRINEEAERVVSKHERLNKLLTPRVVLSGPFEGVKYGTTKAMCSALYPKLLGVYENEITGAIQDAITSNPSLIVDVGAADGYYAVGFALKCPNSQIIAYEQNPRARLQLKNLALLNEVEDRVEIRGHCDVKDLSDLRNKSGLMIIDCEGFESELLTQESIGLLKNWYFIIETHDGFKPDITRNLTNRFSSTHETTIINTIHDNDKIDYLDLSILKSLPRSDANMLVAERREHACLRWIICKPVGYF